jgi:Tfp pilus assembly protein PilF
MYSSNKGNQDTSSFEKAIKLEIKSEKIYRILLEYSKHLLKNNDYKRRMKILHFTILSPTIYTIKKSFENANLVGINLELDPTKRN